MNKKFADNFFRVLMSLAFALGTLGMPTTNARAEEPSPIIWGVTPSNDWISGQNWPAGVNIQITINDPATPQNPDFFENQITDAGGSFYYQSAFDIQVGFGVSATDLNIIKHVTVTNFEVTSIDWIADKVTGVGTPNANAGIWGPGWYYPFVVDGTGNWQIDLAGSADITSETGGMAIEQDANGDGTQSNWEVPKFHAQPDGYANNHIDGFGWPAGTTVFLTIEDPTTPLSPDYSANAVVANPDPWQTNVRFSVTGFDVLAGQAVTLTGSSMTKSLIIETLQITEANALTDIVQGTADPGSEVRINLWCDGCPYRIETADSNGNWIADFSVQGDQPGEDIYDVQPGLQIGALLYDNDSDATRFDLLVPNPIIMAYQSTDSVIFGDWPLGETVTLEIDDPATPESPDYTTTALVTAPEWDPDHSWFVLDFQGIYDLKAGDIVTGTDGITIKQISVTNLTLGNVDQETDVIIGTADPGSSVEVFTGDPWAQRRVIANSSGEWLADFSVPGNDDFEADLSDIAPGDSGMVFQEDEDYDRTAYDWSIPNPMFNLWLDSNTVDSWGWPSNIDITLTIDDPATPTSPDYSEYNTSDMGGNLPSFNLTHSRFYAAEGQSLTMAGGGYSRMMTIPHITVAAINSADDTVTGEAAPGADVHIWSDDGSQRDVTANESGAWLADFSAAQGDQPIVDIVIGSTGNVWVQDADGDQTSVSWHVDYPQCAAGDSVSGAVFETDGVTLIPSARLEFQDFATGEVLFIASTNSNGQYACSLPIGNYRIAAYATDYATEYYDAARYDNATLVTVGAGTQLSGVDFTLFPNFLIERQIFNFNNAQLRILAVRRAIAFGTDRQRILREAFLPTDNFGMVVNSFASPGSWADPPVSDIELYPYDPQQARDILTAAGWIDRDADGYRENTLGVELSFSFKTTTAWPRQLASPIFVENMADIGIRITVEHVPGPQFFGVFGVLEQGNFDIAEYATGTDYEDDIPGTLFATGDPANYGGYSNNAFDTDLANANAAPTLAEKLPFAIDMQKIIMQELPGFPFFTRATVLPIMTHAGTNVSVSPEGYLTVNFDTVTGQGITSVSAAPGNPANTPPGFQLLDKVYEIGSTAVYTGNIQVCFNYEDAGLTLIQEATIRLFHMENNIWTDVTDGGYPDTTNNEICGSVTSFSPFTVLYIPLVPPAAFNKSNPLNNATNQPLNPTLSWDASTGATSYAYCYYTTNPSDCDEPWILTTTSTSVGLSGLSTNTTYHWQVRAVNAGGTTDANGGTWWSFTTISLTLTKTFHSAGAYDGWILESAENSTAGGTLDKTATTFNLGDGVQDKQYRAILHFDTSTLPDTAVITKVTLKIKKQGLSGTNPFTILGGLKVDMRKPYFGANAGLVISDFQAAAGKSAVATFNATPVGNWYSALLNATGRAYVNKTGNTQFRLRFATDDNNDNGADYMKFFSGNYSTASARPTLIIEYYIP